MGIDLYCNEFKMKLLFQKSRTFLRLTFTSFLAFLFYLEANVLLANETSEVAADAKLDPLAWRGDLALWTAVVFLLLLLILCKFAFGPIVKALDQREKNELAKVEATERAQADAKALLQEYRRKLDDSQKEALQIIADARRDAETQSGVIVETARQAAEQERARAIKDIRSASDAALQEIAVKSAELATTLAGKILKEEIDPQKHARVIDSVIDEINATSNS